MQLDELIEKANGESEDMKTPRDITTRVGKLLKDNPDMPWDKAVALIVADCIGYDAFKAAAGLDGDEQDNEGDTSD